MVTLFALYSLSFRSLFALYSLPTLSPVGEPVDPPRDPRATCIANTADDAGLKAQPARVPDGDGAASGTDGVSHIQCSEIFTLINEKLHTEA